MIKRMIISRNKTTKINPFNLLLIKMTRKVVMMMLRNLLNMI